MSSVGVAVIRTKAQKQQAAGWLTPAEISQRLPVSASLVNPQEGWSGISLQRYTGISGTIELPEARDEVLVSYQGAPFALEASGGTSPFERRWVGPGQIGVTPAGCPVRRVLRGKPDLVVVHFDSAELREIAVEVFEADPASITLQSRVGVPDETADRFSRLLLAEAESTMPGMPLMVDGLSRALMLHMLRHYSNLSPQTPAVRASMSPGRVRQVTEHMRAHMDEDLPLSQLAHISGLSPTRFVRAFRDATGRPPHRFLVGLRIERARELLERTDLPRFEVGLRCGFTQPSHFATMFRKITGFSPREWRRTCRS